MCACSWNDIATHLGYGSVKRPGKEAQPSEEAWLVDLGLFIGVIDPCIGHLVRFLDAIALKNGLVIE